MKSLVWVLGVCLIAGCSPLKSNNSNSGQNGKKIEPFDNCQTPDCKHMLKLPVDYNLKVDANEIKVMSYNVENLFDAEHDEGKDDYEYLPIQSAEKKTYCGAQKDQKAQESCMSVNWTDAKVEMKLAQIKRVVDAQGSLPDMMALMEVENDKVVGRLAAKLGYSKFLITNSPDERGIDVALMYNEDKIALEGHQEHVVTYQKPEYQAKPTRNILVAHFRIKASATKKEVVAVYVNHWPSQAAPGEKRYETALQMMKIVDDNAKIFGKENYHVVALGDFNTLPSDIPHPFHLAVEDAKREIPLTDLHAHYFATGYKEDPTKLKSKMPVGTYFYGPTFSWDQLDRFFISGNLLDKAGVEVVSGSYRILGADFLTRKWEDTRKDSHTFGSIVFGAPTRYDHNTESQALAGFSDHFAIEMKVRLQ